MIYNDGTYEENGEVWFVGYLDNVLYHIDSTGKLKVVVKIPTESTDAYRMNPICIKNNNKIICLPDKSKKIIIYDIETKEFKEILLSLSASRYTITNAWVEENILWCISYRTGELIKCNLENQAVEKFFVCTPNLQIGVGEAIKLKQYIYILHKDRCSVTEFDIKTEKETVYELKCEDKGFGTIIFANDSFYLTGFKKNIYKWNKENNFVITLWNGEKIVFDAEKENSIFSRFIQSRYVNGYILFIPNNNVDYICNDIIVYDLEKELVQIYSLKDEKTPRKYGEYLVYNYSIGDSVLIQDYSQDDYWELNIKTGEIVKRKLAKSYEVNDAFWKYNGFNNVYQESEYLRLEDFIANI